MAEEDQEGEVTAGKNQRHSGSGTGLRADRSAICRTDASSETGVARSTANGASGLLPNRDRRFSVRSAPKAVRCCRLPLSPDDPFSVPSVLSVARPSFAVETVLSVFVFYRPLWFPHGARPPAGRPSADAYFMQLGVAARA